MTAGRPVRIALVGAGVRGRDWARVCHDSSDVELAAVVDSDPERAGRVVEELGATTAAVSSEPEGIECDAVIVATPPASHHALVTGAIDAGRHVLCEKPLSEDLAEVEDMTRRAEEAGRTLLVGMNFRYLATSQRIRRYAEGGELGRLGFAQFSYVRHRDGRRADLNDYPLTMRYPMLYEQSIHHFDLIRYCYRTEVEALVADSWRPSWSTYESDCSVSALMRLANGARVDYLGTWTAAWNELQFSWRSDFEHGALVQREQFDDLVRVDFDPELALTGPNFKRAGEGEPARPEELPPCRPFLDDSRRLLDELVAAVRGEAEPVTTARDHLRSLAIVEACIESFETGRWVRLTGE